ncbi:hypothetical protein F8388_025243 [Cannabis sativa]|uniref:SURF1-like protein n=1 Tax=Cannabis sativa TaxID=3483 RepID=A0A7J6FV30_CANSA|nr:hypothetical protein F8388_025243 [Cannabis sativa]
MTTTTIVKIHNQASSEPLGSLLQLFTCNFLHRSISISISSKKIERDGQNGCFFFLELLLLVLVLGKYSEDKISVFQPNEGLDSLEFRKVVCKGHFDEEKSIYIGPRSRSISGVTENGYYVITPLLPIPNCPDSVPSPILVNRGWVPRSWKEKFLEVSHGDQQSKQETHDVQEGERSSWWRLWKTKPTKVQDHAPTVPSVEVVGIVRESEKPSIFVPANEPNSNQWFYVDVPAIARTCGLAENTVYIEDINENVNPSNPYPLPKDVNTVIRSSVMPQDHLNYTFTWYSLSAAVTFMAFKRVRPKKSRR